MHGGGGGGARGSRPFDREPYFDTTASKNVTSLVGKTAHLNCRIRNLGNKTVGSLHFPHPNFKL